MSKKPDQPEKSTVFETLPALMLARGNDMDDGQRPYKVALKDQTSWVVSNSPGQAAQAVCSVEAVPVRDQLAALSQAVAAMKGKE